MNPFLTQVVIQTTLRPKKGKRVERSSVSDYELAKAYRELIITVKRTAKDVALLLPAFFSPASGSKVFFFQQFY
jgi:hypothetical protein